MSAARRSSRPAIDQQTDRTALLPRPNDSTVTLMEMTEDLIRNVIQQVLSQMGTGGPATNGSSPKPSGKDGGYPPADAAVQAAEAAFGHYRKRPLACRRKAVDAIRTLCVEQAEELGRMEL